MQYNIYNTKSKTELVILYNNDDFLNDFSIPMELNDYAESIFCFYNFNITNTSSTDYCNLLFKIEGLTPNKNLVFLTNNIIEYNFPPNETQEYKSYIVPITIISPIKKLKIQLTASMQDTLKIDNEEGAEFILVLSSLALNSILQ